MDSASVRRLLAFIIPALIAAFDQKLGLNLDAAHLEFLGALALGYITQSKWGEVALAKADTAGEAAAAKVQHDLSDQEVNSILDAAIARRKAAQEAAPK